MSDAYKKGRADRAEGKNNPPSWNPFWHTNREIDKIEEKRSEYREGQADKDRDIKREK